MKKGFLHSFAAAGVLLLLFGLFTGAVSHIDVRPVGPEQSMVGFASVNRYVFQVLGENPFWYHLTEWLGIAGILLALFFVLCGAAQLVKRRSVRMVDKNIIALGLVYFIAIAFYLLFEVCIVNYRPVLQNGILEASYPSSHTMVVLCIFGTAMILLPRMIKNRSAGTVLNMVLAAVIAVTVAGRLLSGVHWFTDIAGGVLLGAALTMLYAAAVRYIEYRGWEQGDSTKR